MIQNKLYEILMADNVMLSIKRNEKELFNIIPELKNMVGFLHNHPHHCFDVWMHTLHAINYASANFEIRLVLLLHDIGKPFSFQDGEDGVRHFYGHNTVSALMSEKILKKLNYDANFINRITYLVKFHDTKITKEEIKQDADLQKIRLEIQKCDLMAHNPKFIENKFEYFTEIEKVLNEKNLY